MKKKETKTAGEVLQFPGAEPSEAAKETTTKTPKKTAAKRTKKSGVDYRKVLLRQAMELEPPFPECDTGDGIPVFDQLIFNDAAEHLLRLHPALKACIYLDAIAAHAKISYAHACTQVERQHGGMFVANLPDGEQRLLFDFEIQGFFQEFLPVVILDIHDRFPEYEKNYAEEIVCEPDFRIAMALIGSTLTNMFATATKVPVPDLY